MRRRRSADPRLRDEMQAEMPRSAWSAASPTELATAPRLDRERFRSVANEIKAKTGQKGKQLFHPIRVALTGMAEGPELDLLIPAIDRGAELPASAGLPKIVGCRERAAAFVRRWIDDDERFRTEARRAGVRRALTVTVADRCTASRARSDAR